VDLFTSAPILILIVVCVGLLYWLSYRVRSGRGVNIRPLSGYEALQAQRAKSIETGRGVHFSVGRTDLSGLASPTSIAALSVLDYIAADACASDVPPLTTTGDGTLLLAAQDSLRAAYNVAGRQHDYSPRIAQYLAAENQPMTFAAGTSDIVNRGEVGSNLMIGRFGAELAIVTESAERGDMEQVIGSDDPTAMALAVLATDKVLLGEEVFASGAYLHGEAVQLASIQLQDILRVLAIAGILLATLFYLVVG
jgi:hypothetical protein